MFFLGTASGVCSSLVSAVLLTVTILFSILMTLAVTKVLSATVLKGTPSFFTLELPSYRPPQVGKVIIRSIFDRTLFVLGRAAVVAAPAGILLWVMANVTLGGSSLLSICADFLDPFAKVIGLDGTIMIAFILGFPANEIVMPIIIMAYQAQGSITPLTNTEAIKDIFLQNGWTSVTAICVMVFLLMHWPCSTTLMTVKKETGSIKWTIFAALLPTACGISLCFIINAIAKLFI
ncbi:MAG: ferrous iron transporter B [Clostridia bacterium]|nr:ferrous iron transporter B [Clostridia bacterium]